ncbi:colicin E3/pyocin S6 family cytotoxin [Paucibacter sp. O1-1]|nr:colicin E3/pyocin S6 family cytotoxin [Paucibacter sp. O1-1]MDA3830769.1 colicin E3/pyocin S6 family cytotoxin [Paucibacter sp. O1-1]
MNYNIPPRTLPGFPGAARDKNKSGRARWKTPDGDILEWDYQHGRVGRYDKEEVTKGNLILIPESKPNLANLEEKHRTKEPMETEVQRLISWFDKETDSLISEYNIEVLISLDELKTIFDPYPDDPLMYMVYDISPEIGVSLNKYFPFFF